MNTDTVESPAASIPERKSFRCIRCGFVYQRENDFEPFLCYKCMRFLGKGAARNYLQLVPDHSHSEETSNANSEG